MSRDRDAAGRPRNARPRDAAGRPLPRGSAGVEPAPEVPLPPVAALAEAQRLLDAGRPFAAHEVLEAAWKAAPPGERDLWRGLAQLAVGLTHLQRGNARGAVSLLRRGAEAVANHVGEPPDGLDLTRVADAARTLAGEVAELGAERAHPGLLRLLGGARPVPGPPEPPGPPGGDR